MTDKKKMTIAKKIKAALDSYKAGTGGVPPMYHAELWYSQVTAIDLNAKTVTLDGEFNQPLSFDEINFEQFYIQTSMAKVPREEEECTITWYIDDVTVAAKDLGVHLTRKQKIEILKYIEEHHDSTVGINWDVINDAINTHLGPA